MNVRKMSNYFFEADMFEIIWRSLHERAVSLHKACFKLFKYNSREEKDMLESNFIKFLIQEIIASKEYTIEGVARYARIPDDVLHDIMIGRFSNTLFFLPQRLIELHKSVRPELHQEILKKIVSEYLDKTSMLVKKTSFIHGVC